MNEHNHAYPQGCTCPWKWKDLGRLYGVSFGKGWVRMKDAPNCPVHVERGTEAIKRAIRQARGLDAAPTQAIGFTTSANEV